MRVRGPSEARDTAVEISRGAARPPSVIDRRRTVVGLEVMQQDVASCVRAVRNAGEREPPPVRTHSRVLETALQSAEGCHVTTRNRYRNQIGGVTRPLIEVHRLPIRCDRDTGTAADVSILGERSDELAVNRRTELELPVRGHDDKSAGEGRASNAAITLHTHGIRSAATNKQHSRDDNYSGDDA